MKLSKIERTALHEAAHAFMRHHLGIGMKTIRINPDGGGIVKGGNSSQTIIELEMGITTRRTVNKTIDVIMATIAANIAEKLVTGRFDHLRSSGDYKNALCLASAISADDKEAIALLKWLSAKTLNIIKQEMNMAVIFRLAGVLKERGKLSGKEAKKIIFDSFEEQRLNTRGERSKRK